MAKKQKDWGIPDWRNAADYPKRLTHDQWRWEFLRRRDDYRQEWNDAERVPGFLRHIRRDANARLLLDPRRPAAEVNQFELQIVPKPRAKDRLPWEFDVLAPIKPQLREVERVLRAMQAKAPKVRAQRKPKAREYLWQNFLRALDAKAAGAPGREIAEVILSKKVANYSRNTLGGQLAIDARRLQNNFPAY